MRKVSFRVPDELYDEAVKFAETNGSGFSDVGRLALISLLTHQQPTNTAARDVTQPSLFQLIGLTLSIAEQLGLSSVERADEIAASLAAKHGVRGHQMTALTRLQIGDGR